MRLSSLVLSFVLALSSFAQTQKLRHIEIPDALQTLKKGDVIAGFRTENIYLNAMQQRMGARFIHERTGFTFDYLRIESVPQGYTWVNTFPSGDQGEPHTQEHLLLHKGTVGRSFAGLDTMWLSSSTAFTQQWRTSYHFNTAAGEDVFFDLLLAQLNAMLHPNYTDEEIRREVRNFGVTQNPDGTLRLEEKGTVYNEMTGYVTNRYTRMYRTIGQLVYGATHPLSYNYGGEPSGIRTMKPEHIREFHKNNYYLANMGTMAAFPKTVKLEDVLRRTDEILKHVDPAPKSRESTRSTPLPEPQAAKPGTISITEYPHRNEQQPSPLAFVWPATRRDLPPEELLLLELFLDAYAGDATTPVYKMFVDSKTRVMDTGATAVFGYASRDLGHPIAIILDNVAPANLTDKKIAEIRQKIMSELAMFLKYSDTSTAVVTLNQRVTSRFIETERELANFVNTPPNWGARGTGSSWMDQLLLLERTNDFERSVTLKPQLAFVRDQVTSGKNIWRHYLQKWQIIGVTPYVAAAKPSPALLQREETERAQRVEEETKRLAAHYQEADAQAALKRYQSEQDAELARIEEAAKKIPQAQFTKKPPMSLDDALDFKIHTVTDAEVPLVASRFESMTSATFGVALHCDHLPREQLRYLSLMPALLTRVGVIENRPLSYEEMSERMRREILRLEAYFSTNPRTGRVELALRGAGIGAKETYSAISWMSHTLFSPNWTRENLPRIRDVVDQQLSTFRNMMQGPEESWVTNPATAYRLQDNPHFLAADSFLTRSHNALRLRWLLKDVPTGADVQALQQWFTALEKKTGTREQLKAALAAQETFAGLSSTAKTVAQDAAKDLDLTLIEIPDSSLAADWKYLVSAMKSDLFTDPVKTLDMLHTVRRALLPAWNARLFLVTSQPIEYQTISHITNFASQLDTKVPRPAESKRAPKVVQHIDERLRARDKSAKNPLHAGLLAPNMTGGVIITSVPGVHFADAKDKEKQLDYLASRLYAGYGAHGIFLKTLAQGLAYSNGIRASVQQGRIGYYAERTPELPQTVKFVIDTLKNAERDTRLADYAVAQVFGESRAAGTYEARAEGMANDLMDRQPRHQVQQFRQSILDLRADPTLGEKLFARKDAVYARILPGYDPNTKPVAGAQYFTIGPDKQLNAWEAYLQKFGGKLYRLYPRDFWMP